MSWIWKHSSPRGEERGYVRADEVEALLADHDQSLVEVVDDALAEAGIEVVEGEDEEEAVLSDHALDKELH